MTHPTRTASLLLTALLAASLVPATDAELNARSFVDVSSGFDMGDGLGLYDPVAPPTYCAALLSFYTGVNPVLFYYAYDGVRYWPWAAGGAAQNVGFQTPDPLHCATTVPGNQIVVDSVQADAGVSFRSMNLLGPTQVANLGATQVDLQYCTGPSAVPGSVAGVAVPDPASPTNDLLAAFTAKWVECGEDWVDYNLVPSCPGLTLTTAVGQLDVDQPVFLGTGPGCNSQFGSPANVDFVTQHCVRTEATDVTTGDTTLEEDSDFFVTAKDGSLAAWATATALPPADMFANVANLEADAIAPSCFPEPDVEHSFFPHAHVTIHRFPQANGGLQAISAAPGFTCVETGNTANVIGSSWTPITSPGSVTCTPTQANSLCGNVRAIGYHGATSGTITITSACTGLSTSVTISGQLADQASTNVGLGTFGWTCSVAESPWQPNDDWWTGCDVNL